MTSFLSSIRCSAVARALLLLVAALLTACASVPYQEMSDARQAIDAARPVVEDEPGPRARVSEAESLLEQAERHLHAGEYGKAKRTAEQAKELAIDAREAAETDDP